MIYTLRREHWIAHPIDEAFSFFPGARKLGNFGGRKNESIDEIYRSHGCCRFVGSWSHLDFAGDQRTAGELHDRAH